MVGGVLILLVLAGVFWVLPMYIAGKSTEGKGYKPSVGVLLGACLGWLGALIAALLPVKVVPAKDLVACPHCAEQIQPAAKVCRFCGHDIEPVRT